jgi:isocitrate lyase
LYSTASKLAAEAGADLLWIETEKPRTLAEIAQAWLNRVKRSRSPTPSWCTTTAPSFNWTLNFRQQAYSTAWTKEGKDVVRLRPRQADGLRKYDGTELSIDADRNRIQ